MRKSYRTGWHGNHAWVALQPTHNGRARRCTPLTDPDPEPYSCSEKEAGKSYCSRRFCVFSCNDTAAHIYAPFSQNDCLTHPAELSRFPEGNVIRVGKLWSVERSPC